MGRQVKSNILYFFTSCFCLKFCFSFSNSVWVRFTILSLADDDFNCLWIKFIDIFLGTFKKSRVIYDTTIALIGHQTIVVNVSLGRGEISMEQNFKDE